MEPVAEVDFGRSSGRHINNITLMLLITRCFPYTAIKVP